MLYGGVGTVLAGTLAPAAGITMQALADEAGPDLADWAKRRSPRFYAWVANLADVAGPGKYIGAPLLSEAYARTPGMRPALGAPLQATLGDDAAEIVAIGELYDRARAEQDERRAQADAARVATTESAQPDDQADDDSPAVA
jgi:hypothetical protein